MKIIVTTYPFGYVDPMALGLLESHDVRLNDLKRKFTPDEVRERLIEFQPDVIIAGTEKYTAELFDELPNLKMISKVGVGHDSVPLDECVKHEIVVTYTPNAPSNAVAELTIGQMLNALRHIQIVDRNMRGEGNNWTRMVGREIMQCNIGIIGCGRIGTLLSQKLRSFNPARILVNDIIETRALAVLEAEPDTYERIFTECDIVTMHIPFNEANHNLIGSKYLDMMKPDACLINMSRGGIVDESALFARLQTYPDFRAVIDTFETEPYTGELLKCQNALLTPHLGSCSKTSRRSMEVGASEEVLRFINGDDQLNKLV